MTQWPETRRAWRRLRTNWRLLRAEKMLQKAGDILAKEGCLDLAVRAYTVAIDSAGRTDLETGEPHATPPA